MSGWQAVDSYLGSLEVEILRQAAAILRRRLGRRRVVGRLVCGVLQREAERIEEGR